jgi:hypothetical protein
VDITGSWGFGLTLVLFLFVTALTGLCAEVSGHAVAREPVAIG